MRLVHGPGAAGVAARLEVHEQRGAARAIAGVVEREDFRVRLAGARVPALADHDAVRRDDDGADHRIRRRDAFGRGRMKQRAPHEVGVGHHFSWKIAST